MKAMKTAIALLFCSSVITGCSSVNNNGGTAGWVQDKVIYKARNDAEYVYRALYITAALAKAAEANHNVISNSGNTRHIIAQINGITENLSEMNQVAYSQCGDNQFVRKVIDNAPDLQEPTGCQNTSRYRTRFQPMTADVDRQLVNLAAIALGVDDFKTFHASISVGNYVDALLAIVPVLVSSLDMGNEMAAVSRERRQGYAYMNAKANSTLSSETTNGINRSFSYEEAMGLPLDPQKLIHPNAMAHYSGAAYYTLVQSCLNIRGNLNQSEQSIANVNGSSFYVLGAPNSSPTATQTGITINNCPSGYFTGEKFVSMFKDDKTLVDGLNAQNQSLPGK